MTFLYLFREARQLLAAYNEVFVSDMLQKPKWLEKEKKSGRWTANVANNAKENNFCDDVIVGGATHRLSHANADEMQDQPNWKCLYIRSESGIPAKFYFFFPLFAGVREFR